MNTEEMMKAKVEELGFQMEELIRKRRATTVEESPFTNIELRLIDISDELASFTQQLGRIATCLEERAKVYEHLAPRAK